jgi:DNA repair exonuclease SbcCD ATPase subunit
VARSVHRNSAVDTYISNELIAKLRKDQRHLRKTIRALETAAKQADVERLTTQLRELNSTYQSYERLVGALLEAVEPDGLPPPEGS